MLTKIKLGDIKIKFIGYGDVLLDNHDVDFLPIKWNKRHEKLKITFFKEDYKPDIYGYIVVSNDGFCVDGQHRICLLIKKYGYDHEIMVKKDGRNWWNITLKNLFSYILPFNKK